VENNWAHTGTSIILTIALVFLSPRTKSQRIKAKNSNTSRATDAGKETELRLIRELVPKHARRIIRIPKGT